MERETDRSREDLIYHHTLIRTQLSKIIALLCAIVGGDDLFLHKFQAFKSHFDFDPGST